MAEGKGLSECSPHPSVIASASEAIRRWCGVILSVAKNLLPQQNSVPYPQNPPAATPYRTPHRRGNPRGCPGRAPPRPPLSCTRHSHATLVVACPLHRDRYPLAHPEPRVYPEYGRREGSERVLPPPFRHFERQRSNPAARGFPIPTDKRPSLVIQNAAHCHS